MAPKGKAKGKGVRVTVRGQVQGVGFRYLTVERAHELGVLGWVRNEDDGTVHAHLEGEAAAVDELVEWSRQGPPKAQVDHVHVVTADVSGNWSTFED